MTAAESFYRRPWPDPLVAFSSTEGRIIFHESLEHWASISPYFSNIIPVALLEARADLPITAIKIILKNLPDHSRILQKTNNNGIPFELKAAVRSNSSFKVIETALVSSAKRFTDPSS